MKRLMAKENFDSYAFHYASPRAFAGIMKTGKIWATQIGFLNDASEIDYPFELSEEIAEEVLNKGKEEDKEELEEQLRKYKDLCVRDPKRIHRFLDTSTHEQYVACFSKEPDNLNLWRAYCPNGGYSIGIHQTDLARYVRGPNDEKVEYMSCMYRETEHRKEITEAIESSLKMENKDDTGKEYELCLKMIVKVKRAAISIKKECFKGEEESRLACSVPTSKNVKLDDGINYSKPYIELELNKIKNQMVVFVGPSHHQKLLYLAAFYSHNLYGKKIWTREAKIIASEIPYRAG